MKAIDTTSVGYVTLEKWVSYATTHILGKIDRLPKDYLGGCRKEPERE
jgi:hypothetical protein